ncbi:hypothetical protein ACSBL2_19120 [Pedobacter sp. AW31-3R]|uniref:hypothetical protein n=1 Tax=Pedobacter sp. AW31-3R TaxID=3445781 RepID=UPI003FA16319
MKKIFFLLLLYIGSHTLVKAQTYSSPALKEAVTKHKIVAILPFETRISYKIPDRRLDMELNANNEINLQQTVQSSLYNFLLDRSDKNTVEFQDIDKTNILLEKAAALNNLHQLTKEEIARILGVDAVISGKYEIEHRNQLNVSTKGGRGDSKSGDKKPAEQSTKLPEPTGLAATTITLHDASTGSLLWRYTVSTNDYEYSTKLLVDDLMKKTSKNFPYSSKK